MVGSASSARRTASLSSCVTHTNGMAHASTHQANRIVKNAAETVGIQGILYVDSNGVERKKATAHTLRHSSPFVISKEDKSGI